MYLNQDNTLNLTSWKTKRVIFSENIFEILEMVTTAASGGKVVRQDYM